MAFTVVTFGVMVGLLANSHYNVADTMYLLELPWL